MIWHLVALLSAGLGAAGIALLLRMASGKKLPKWFVPALAGIGMLTYQIYYEYSWIDHKRTQLPDGASIVRIEQVPSIWRPWTFVIPMTTGFTVIDTARMVKTEQEGQSLAQFFLYRFEKAHVDIVASQAYLLNCSTREQVLLNEAGEVQGPVFQLTSSDPVYEAVCN
ncbi:hypothetical protein [Stutzerimonas kirkiae]|uniref:Uncharacterized protein n=1 Tax=Stutzerimonas kirkiae TaxID=2211392 RepID=A0A4Q9RAY3_9GAMM|nr:hypothetical protein [Stutzerimonas kirkiae]TBU97932.1 hypothetical protein DNJ96_07360 [Stutzerimonas kirkiae]TBV04552.1 hypothetical protein DNJ95_04910 [Stutzerimonas kirkiae]TBV11588.1 hypothetical protein DNK08_02965 [Stutzerimonas kirkiae]TBV16110.1 hypothetical protein DNK01_03835 [Stutzerimonas kirkiae]